LLSKCSTIYNKCEVKYFHLVHAYTIQQLLAFNPIGINILLILEMESLSFWLQIGKLKVEMKMKMKLCLFNNFSYLFVDEIMKQMSPIYGIDLTMCKICSQWIMNMSISFNISPIARAGIRFPTQGAVNDLECPIFVRRLRSFCI
jgi:hypothetical protein